MIFFIFIIFFVVCLETFFFFRGVNQPLYFHSINCSSTYHKRTEIVYNLIVLLRVQSLGSFLRNIKKNSEKLGIYYIIILFSYDERQYK